MLGRGFPWRSQVPFCLLIPAKYDRFCVHRTPPLLYACQIVCSLTLLRQILCSFTLLRQIVCSITLLQHLLSVVPTPAPCQGCESRSRSQSSCRQGQARGLLAGLSSPLHVVGSPVSVRADRIHPTHLTHWSRSPGPPTNVHGALSPP